MKNKTKKIFIFSGIILAFFLAAGSASALELHYPTIFGYSINDTSTLAKYTCYLYALITALAFFVTIIIVAFGGIYYLISYGKGKFTDEGKNWIKAGLLGLLIVACATLIINTINPNLGACKLAFLPAIPGFNTSNNSTNPPGIPIASYQEIPIGTLTENLLTRITDCYGFDNQGNPVAGDKINTDDKKTMDGPTHMNHDRADCVLQMADAIQKKSQIVAKLSDAITALMDTCSCKGKCSDSCGGQNGCNEPTACPILPEPKIMNKPLPGVCGGSCAGKDGLGAACVPQSNGPPDCCPTTDAKTGKKLTVSVKNQIEHGPVIVSLSVDNCSTSNVKNNTSTGPTATFLGLDEFRSTKTYADIKKIVEKTVSVKKLPVEIINTGNCGTCQDNCQTCDTASPNYSTCKTQRDACEKKVSDCQQQVGKCNSNSAWGKLKLIDQLTYLKGKIDEIKQNIQKDEDELDSARSTLGECYLAIPYVDLLKLNKNTNQRQQIVSVDDENFVDPITNQPIDASKYCTGFNYSNSSCLQNCNNKCPDTSVAAMAAYKKCDINCKGYNVDCINDRQKCIEEAYLDRPCPSVSPSSGAKIPATFQDCVTSCQSDCAKNCSKFFIAGSDEYNTCQNQCSGNSKCVLDNANSCLLDGQKFVGCAENNDPITDPGNTQNCINNAYLCKNGSDQYAGYQDCVEPLTKKNACSSITKQTDCDSVSGCEWVNGACSRGYSASFFYNQPNYEKCYNPKDDFAEPYNPPDPTSSCYNSKVDPKTKSTTPNNVSCQDVCPEVAKCPASSNCPYCPCDQLGDTNNPKQPLTINFSIPKTSVSDVDDPGYNVGNEGCTIDTEKLSANQMAGAQCTEYSYNDDPLTFYCQDNWWKDPNREGLSTTPIGEKRGCSKDGEIPVGKTVDDAKVWANSLMANIDKTVQNAQKILTDMQKAGDALKKNPIVKDYCKCNAKYVDKKPVCKSFCGFNQTIIVDENTGVGGWSCSCDFNPCEGNSCQQMINWMSDIWNDYQQTKTDFINFDTTMLKEPRSDIMKELIYSRQSTSSCSQVAYTQGTQEKIMSCSRVEDEVISPIDDHGKYCYGINLGKFSVPSADLTDNWFCCQEYLGSTDK